MTKERRITTRVPVSIEVEGRTAGAKGGWRARTADLSLTGARLEGAPLEADGARVDVRLALADGLESAAVQGEVVDARSGRIRFVKLRTRDCVRIAEAIFG